MVYLDTSAALAHLLAEDRVPPDSLWDQPLVSSRLLEYELWNRLHARGSTADAPHLASMEFLRAQRQAVAPASYDLRMLDDARHSDRRNLNRSREYVRCQVSLPLMCDTRAPVNRSPTRYFIVRRKTNDITAAIAPMANVAAGETVCHSAPPAAPDMSSAMPLAVA